MPVNLYNCHDAVVSGLENHLQNNHNRTALVIRSALYWVWLIVNTLFMTLPVFLTGFFSRKLSFKLAQVWCRLNLLGLKLICNLSCKTDGEENIPDHACIVMSKHQSTLETFHLSIMFPQFVFVAKRSLTMIPIFGWALLLLKFILIDRKSGKTAIAQMVEQSRDRIANDVNVIIFPEGTRMPVNAPPNYRMGGAVVASKIGADILPVAHNAGEFWPRLGFIKWPGEVTISIGPVIRPHGKKPDDILRETQQWIEGRMKEITVPDRFPYTRSELSPDHRINL